MTILLILDALVVLYLLIAVGFYTWAMWGSDNVLQKSMSVYVVGMALLWPLGLLLWAASERDKEHDEEHDKEVK